MASKYKKEFANEIMELQKAISSSSPEEVKKYKKEITYYSSCIKKIDACKTVRELRNVLAILAVEKATKHIIRNSLMGMAIGAGIGVYDGASLRIKQNNKNAMLKKSSKKIL